MSRTLDAPNPRWCTTRSPSESSFSLCEGRDMGDHNAYVRIICQGQRPRRLPDVAKAGDETVEAYAKRWLDDRAGRVDSIRDDRSRMRDHVLPTLGPLDVRTFPALPAALLGMAPNRPGRFSRSRSSQKQAVLGAVDGPRRRVHGAGALAGAVRPAPSPGHWLGRPPGRLQAERGGRPSTTGARSRR